MKKYVFPILLPACLAARAQSLQIHQIGLADGDASLIIAIDSVKPSLFVPPKLDTAVVLIDAQREYCGPPLYNYIDSVLKSIGRTTLDYAVVSHMHIDHYGSMVQVLDTLIHRGYKVTKLIDVVNLLVPNVDMIGDSVDSCYDYIGTPSLSGSAGRYKQFAGNYSALGIFTWTSLLVGSDLLFWKNFKDIKMTCVAAKGMAKDATSGVMVFLPARGGGYFTAKSQNDLSYCFLLSFQGFHYFTGGDIGGGGTYADGETPIARYLRATYGPTFHFCAFKVSHHGSNHSTNQTFLDSCPATLAVIPAALRSFSGTRLPTAGTVGRLNTAGDSIRYTFIPSNPGAPVGSWNLNYLQDVVITIPAAPGYGHPINMQVSLRRRNVFTRLLDGTVVNETITCNKTHNF